MIQQATRRAVRRPAVLLALLLATGAIALVGSNAAGADSGSDKVIVCHATASNTNPWVRIEVSANAVPAHLGQVGNSHQHQQSLGRHDFVWTSDYDEECVLLPVTDPDPIRVDCSQEPSIIAVPDDGEPTAIDCEIGPNGHSEVLLPIGVHMIECGRGTTTAPNEVSYWLHPGGVQYVINCIEGDVVDLGIQGGPVQVLCPLEGVVKLYKDGLLGGIVAQSFPCTPNQLVPNSTTTMPGFVDAIYWPNTSVYYTGLIGCPQDGSLELFFLGEGGPSTNPLDAVSFPCAFPGSVDVTRLTMTV